ncbi:nicotinate phosphoribosyltransferase [Fomitopsis serialis]|uniref:nicotinate phosphoribosyltransferase n=1 Tax=Fomitopsis serialis TaxID=139415 RepID=UPI0020078D12|nr:nicotinate phosphoribosyltransferase [Neoantrodia serialis]KAH9925514.1 nicotinate phosphoribosyltransferase [Neoantrodia serialis]
MSSTGILPTSLLDTDLYKFTMQQAVLRHFPDVQATYRFTHRDKDVPFTRECVDTFRESVSKFGSLRLTDEEYAWLKTTCPYFNDEYLQYLRQYRFKPEQVSVRFLPLDENPTLGHLEIEAVGPWLETILWEVPLMACLSELYFKFVDTDWNYDGQEEQAYAKAEDLVKAGCAFSEFGTRRRRSCRTQDTVIRGLVRASKEFPGPGKLTGTSNVHLAHVHGLSPVGTIAHEWFMGIGALKGYEHANGTALALWEEVYPDALQLALTDTFSTEVFYKDFIANPERARRWKGLRQDSGDPFIYAPRAKEVYESLGINHREKIIIFSDALSVEKAKKLKAQCDEVGFTASFGIGTTFTNDFKKVSSGGKEKSKALNMVIKLAAVDGKPCVKISDELTKNTGDTAIVKLVKEIYHLPL